jgi:hypothetical protein
VVLVLFELVHKLLSINTSKHNAFAFLRKEFGNGIGFLCIWRDKRTDEHSGKEEELSKGFSHYMPICRIYD